MGALPSPQRLKSEIEHEWTALSFHYHLSFEEIARMPRWARKLYLRALPRHLASQQLAAVEAAVYPRMKRPDQQRMSRSLTRKMNQGLPRQKPKPVRATNESEHQQAMAAIGVGIEIEGKE